MTDRSRETRGETDNDRQEQIDTGRDKGRETQGQTGAETRG